MFSAPDTDSGLFAINQDKAFPGIGQSNMLVRRLIVSDPGEERVFLLRGHANAGVNNMEIQMLLLLVNFDLNQTFPVRWGDSVMDGIFQKGLDQQLDC